MVSANVGLVIWPTAIALRISQTLEVYRAYLKDRTAGQSSK